jgi:hypothetical protein
MRRRLGHRGGRSHVDELVRPQQPKSEAARPIVVLERRHLSAKADLNRALRIDQPFGHQRGRPSRPVQDRSSYRQRHTVGMGIEVNQTDGATMTRTGAGDRPQDRQSY